jgi:hypothetical protein
MFAKFCRLVTILLLIGLISGCVYWRLLQIKIQLNEFDQYFSVIVADDFTWHFKQPLVYSDDFTFLSKLQPSSIQPESNGQEWQYLFRKVNGQGKIFQPEVSYFFTLKFNQEQRLTDFSLSPLFLNMVPTKFLEASLRSLGSGDIYESTRQLKVSADKVLKISSNLPKQAKITQHFGQPIEITEEDGLDVYLYHFRLETPYIEKGYEDRALTVLKLWFDKKNQELVKFGGRFAGLKLRIDYREYQQNPS